jgi:uncharacterized protein (DUF2249 family)
MDNEPIIVDVRDDIRNGHEPFSRIMNAVRELRPEQKLLLIAPFEPIPLFGVLRKQGFAHDSREAGNGVWEVLFTRAAQLSNGHPPVQEYFANGKFAKRESGPSEIKFIEVDARGLEPPQPMVKILEALADLPAGVALCARTDRRPMHLYAQLEARGFTGNSEEQNDGSFITHIRAR